MSYAAYRDTVVAAVNAKTGLDLVWDDFLLSGITPMSGAKAEVTITPTQQGSVKFKGSATFIITRMDLTNATYVINGVDVRYIDELVSNPSALVALLSKSSGEEFLIEDFTLTSISLDSKYDTRIVLTAKSDSYYYYGSLAITFSHSVRNQVTMDIVLPSALTVTTAMVGSGFLFVDGINAKLPYDIPTGTHTVSIIDFTTISSGLAAFKPTRLKDLQLVFNNHTGLFANATTLNAIDNECIKLSGVDCTTLFYKCTGLTTLPSSLFYRNSKSGNIGSMFRGTGITTTSAGLFSNLTGVTDISYLFADCSALKTIATGTLDPLGGSVVSSLGVFMNTGVTAIPAGLLSKFFTLNSATYWFQNCTSLVDIPETLFSSPILLNDISYFFAGCTGIKTIPTNLLKPLINLTLVNYLFSGCIGITAIPSTLLTTNLNLVQASGLFLGTGITTMPTGLFSVHARLVWGEKMFMTCPNLKTIPTDLFSACPALSRISYLFYNSAQIEAIPATLFANNANLTYVDYAFSGIPTSFTIPSNFFPGNSLNSIVGVFKNSGLQAIPVGGFSSHSKITFAESAFENTGIVSVPASTLTLPNSTIQTLTNLFANCVNLTTVSSNAVSFVATNVSGKSTLCDGLFDGCINLVSLGVNAVSGTGLVTNISRLCKGCIGLTYTTTELTQRLAITTTLTMSDTNSTYIASSAFEGCRKITGSCAVLWNYYNGNPGVNVRRTYTNFIEKNFLLTDYTAVGKPWWTTPIDLSIGLIQPIPWLLDDYVLPADKPNGYDHIPLYVSYYGTFGDLVAGVRSLPTVSNYTTSYYILTFQLLAKFMGVTFNIPPLFSGRQFVPSASNGLNTAYTRCYVFNFENIPVNDANAIAPYNYAIHYTQ